MQRRYTTEVIYSGRLSRCALIGLVLLFGFCRVFHAQETSPTVPAKTISISPLSDESPFVQLQANGFIGGTVFDVNEGMVVGAQVTLETLGRQIMRVTTTDDTGSYFFNGLPIGAYKVRVVALGLEHFESSEITLHDGERYQLPNVMLSVATASIDVTVSATEEEVAQEQVIAEIHQRVFGIFPNFYTSFVWDAAPLNRRQKFHLAFRAAVDPVTFFTTGMLSGIQQGRDSYPEYGQGTEGYAKRYGANFGDLFIGRMIGAAVLPSILHQDPRYFYQGTGSFRSRAWHALASAFVTRGDNGRAQFNYSHIFGNLAAGAISNLYRPDSDRGVVLTINNALLHTAANATGNLVREFGLRGITTKVPSYAKGRREPVASSKP